MDSKHRRAHIAKRKAEGMKYPDIIREMHGRKPKADGGEVSRYERMRKAQQYRLAGKEPPPELMPTDSDIAQGEEYSRNMANVGNIAASLVPVGGALGSMARRAASVPKTDQYGFVTTLPRVKPDKFGNTVPRREPYPDGTYLPRRYADGGEVDRRRQKIQAYTSRGLEPPADLMDSTNRITSPERQRVEEEAVFDIGSNAAMLAAPVARPLAAVGRAIAAHPVKSGLGAFGAAATVGSAEAGGESPYEKRMMDYAREESAAAQRIQELERARQQISDELNAEMAGRGGRKPGEGPNTMRLRKSLSDWDAANAQSLTDARARQAAISQAMQAYEKENSPAAIRERQAKAPIKEAFPLETGFAQIGIAGLGLGSALAMKGRGLSSYNSRLQALDSARNAAVTRATLAKEAGDVSTAARLTDEAIRLTDEIASVVSKGPNKRMTVAPAIAGMELAALGPTVVDYFRSSGPEDPRYKAAIDMMTGGERFPGENLAARSGLAAVTGIAAAKIPGAGLEAWKGRYTPGSAAATDALAAEARGELSGMAKGFADTAVNAAKQDARIIAANDRRAGLSETAAENRDSAVLRRALAAARAQAEQGVAQGLGKLTPAERASMRSRQLDLDPTPPAQPQRQLPPPAAPTSSPKQALPPPSNPTTNVPSNASSVNIDSGAITKALGKVDPAVMSRMVADPAVAQAKIKSLISMQTGKAPKDISQAEIDAGMDAFKSMTGRKDGGAVAACRSMKSDKDVIGRARRACGGRVKRADGGSVTEHWSWTQPRDRMGRWA